MTDPICLAVELVIRKRRHLASGIRKGLDISFQVVAKDLHTAQRIGDGLYGVDAPRRIPVNDRRRKERLKRRSGKNYSIS